MFHNCVVVCFCWRRFIRWNIITNFITATTCTLLHFHYIYRVELAEVILVEKRLKFYSYICILWLIEICVLITDEMWNFVNSIIMTIHKQPFSHENNNKNTIHTQQQQVILNSFQSSSETTMDAIHLEPNERKRHRYIGRLFAQGATSAQHQTRLNRMEKQGYTRMRDNRVLLVHSHNCGTFAKYFRQEIVQQKYKHNKTNTEILSRETDTTSSMEATNSTKTELNLMNRKKLN